MGIYAVAPVEYEPYTTLVTWEVFEATFEDGTSSIHFIGSPDDEDGRGRVCSAIQSFDKDKKCGISRSGRHYILSGPPGYSNEAHYVWEFWKRKNKVISEVNVTKDYE